MSAIAQMKAMKWQTLMGALEVSVVFSITKPKTVKRDLPVVKPDIDNFQKSLFDALNLIAWKDDSQIVKCASEKTYGTPGIFLQIREL